MLSELLFAPSKSKTTQTPQKSDIKMKTSLLPQARFLLDFKANSTGTQIFLVALHLLATHSISYVIWWKRHGYTFLECLIRIILLKSSTNYTLKATWRRFKHQCCIWMSSQPATLQTEITCGLRTAYICFIIHLLFSSTGTFRKKCLEA